MDLQTIKSKAEKVFEVFAIVVAFLVLIYLPFYELFLHFLQSYTHLSDEKIFWISHFYEPILLLLLLAFGIKFAVTRKLPKFERVDLFIFAFIAWTFIAVAVHFGDLSRGLEGVRFLLLPYALYTILRLSNYKKPHHLIQIYLFIAILFAALGVVEYFLLPKGYMDIYYKIADFGFGQNGLVSVSQATAFLAGPNQLASYLILPYFYLLHRIFSSKKELFTNLDSYLLLLVTLAIGLTYSRSALIGLVVGTILLFFCFGKEQREKIIYMILFIVAAITLAISYALANGELPSDLLTHGSSFSQHFSSTKNSFMAFIHGGFLKILFGFGVGSAGPTALKLGGVISENYYLQVVYELGLVGISLFFAFLYLLLKKLFSSSKTLFFAFIALLVNALFLHIFSDNPAMAASVFIILATVINVETQNSGSG